MRNARVLSLVAAVLALAGCTATQETPHSNTPDGFQSLPAGFALNLPVEMQPDYSKPGALQQAIFGEEDSEVANAERIAQLERQLLQQQIQREQGPALTAGPLAPAGPGPYVKLGLIATGGADPALLQRLESQLAALAPAYGSHLLPAGAVRAQLVGYGCDAATIGNCLGRLAVYPGLHTVAVLDVRAGGDDRRELTITLHDAAHQISYPAQRLTVPAADGQVTAASLEAVAMDILQRSREAAALAPWSTRAFGREGGQWYIAGGQRSGLEIGDVLEVREGGRLVRSPTGTPAGWIPGQLKGKLRVVSFLGEDNAVAELIEGEPPSQTDHLLPAATR